MKVPAAKKLPSGAWRCQIMVGGKRHSVTAPTKREAERQAAAIKSGYLAIQEKPDALTLEKAIDGYIEIKSGVLSPSTIEGYRKIQRNNFKTLMQKNINSITQKILQAAVTSEAAIYSPKTVCNAYGLVRSVLKFYGIVVGDVKLPQQRKPDRRYLQNSEIPKLLEAIDGDKCEVPILLAIWLGLRKSEILGLCWDCVDLDRGTITIRRAYVYAGAREWVLKEDTKTTASQRTIQIPEYILERFRRLPAGDGRVFDGYDPGLPRKHLQRACDRCGITMTTLHGLRHTFAAVMLSNGVSERVVMREGGWSSSRTMREIYDYIMDDETKRAHDIRDSAFTPKKKE